MADTDKNPVCGLVMPISAVDGCSEAHWADVLNIHSDAIKNAGFEPNLVSNADDVGIIQKRIIQNLYDNPVVVVDVSGKNSNVMFELGIRLAFDRPTVIVKDDKTSFSFDTAPIEHLPYPRDLRFAQITDFKDRLSAKISATHKSATSDPNYTTFLKHFGEFTVAKLDKKEVPAQEFMIEEIRALRVSVQRLEQVIERSRSDGRPFDVSDKNESAADILKVSLPDGVGPQEIWRALKKNSAISRVVRSSRFDGNKMFIKLDRQTRLGPVEEMVKLIEDAGGKVVSFEAE